jgi:hypothetical protein
MEVAGCRSLHRVISLYMETRRTQVDRRLNQCHAATQEKAAVIVGWQQQLELV